MRGYEAGVYDVYDDDGKILKKVVTDPEDLPDFVKTAAQVGRDAHNNNFALVMVDGEKVMRKFATADRGNTWLSALYFAFTKDNLPEEAQKVAAANLIEACEAFEIETPEMLFEYADGPAGTNIVDVTATKPKMKVASVQEPVEYAVERADGTKHYPLRDSAQVKTAMDYFQRFSGQFVPRERREYAVKVASLAEKGNFPLPEEIKKYAGVQWNPSVAAHLTQRYLFLTDSNAPITTKERLVKLAGLQKTTEPEDFAEMLEVFDCEFGLDALWDKNLADPWFATFAPLEKTAKGTVAPDASYTIGEVRVLASELHYLAENGFKTVKEHFGCDFAEDFLKNPEQQFEALPAPQRKLVAKMASSFRESSATP